MQPAQALRRLDVASLGLVDELVERGDLVEPERARELRDRLDGCPAGAPEGDHQCRWQHDDARLARAARNSDPSEPLLCLTHRRAGEAK